ncbi:MAG: hypothetical protein IJ833_00090 [Lachnospiraceae bacterium]|nr:hypothetical protein [Lachnospiraceae bacterium]
MRMKENIFCELMEQINLSEEQKQSIVNNCLQQKHAQNKWFVYSKQIAAVLVVGVLSATTLTAYGAVSAYQAYMEQMSREEMQERYEEIQEGTKDADTFSRPLSENEQERLNQMRQLYQSGQRFPEQAMVIVDGSKEVIVDKGEVEETFYYDCTHMVFYLPERELTDEELLQIIDVWEKGNYSLGVINGERGLTNAAATDGDHTTADGEGDADEAARLKAVEAEMEDFVHDVPEVDQERIRQAVVRKVKELTGKDTGEASWLITLYGDDTLHYLARYEDEKESVIFNFTTDSTPEHLTVYSYMNVYKDWPERSASVTSYTEETLLQEIQSLGVQAEEQLVKIFGVEAQIVKCEYGYQPTVLTGETSLIEFVLTAGNGDRYRMYYRVSDKRFVDLLTYRAGKYDDVTLPSGRCITGELSLEKKS